MPYLRFNPHRTNLLSFRDRDGAAIQRGEDFKVPAWHVVNKDTATRLAERRVDYRDPGSACIFDILPDKKSAKAFEHRELAARKKLEAGKSVGTAISGDGSTVDTEPTEREMSLLRRIRDLESAMAEKGIAAPSREIPSDSAEADPFADDEPENEPPPPPRSPPKNVLTSKDVPKRAPTRRG